MTGPEIVEFSKAIKLAYEYDDLAELLQSMDLSITDYVTANAKYPTQIQELVGVFNSKGWILKLVSAVVKDRPNSQPIQNFLSRHRYWDPANHPPTNDHPWDTLRVLGGRSFIARDRLRRALKKMDQKTGRKVLVITSAYRKVGKTYSKDLIEFVSSNLPPSDVAYADLDNETYTPIRLAKKLAKEMKLDASLIPNEATEQASRSNQELVSFLIPSRTDPAPMVWWIVLDGFREQIPSEEIQEFIAQLGERIQGTEEFRLILLNYDYTLPLAVAGFSIMDNLEPLTRPELERHFTHVHRQKHNTDPSDEQLAAYLAGMDALLDKLTQENPESVNDQMLINIAVTTVVDTIEEGKVL